MTALLAASWRKSRLINDKKQKKKVFKIFVFLGGLCFQGGKKRRAPREVKEDERPNGGGDRKSCWTKVQLHQWYFGKFSRKLASSEVWVAGSKFWTSFEACELVFNQVVKTLSPQGPAVQQAVRTTRRDSNACDAISLICPHPIWPNSSCLSCYEFSWKYNCISQTRNIYPAQQRAYVQRVLGLLLAEGVP